MLKYSLVNDTSDLGLKIYLIFTWFAHKPVGYVGHVNLGNVESLNYKRGSLDLNVSHLNLNLMVAHGNRSVIDGKVTLADKSAVMCSISRVNSVFAVCTLKMIRQRKKYSFPS